MKKKTFYRLIYLLDPRFKMKGCSNETKAKIAEEELSTKLEICGDVNIKNTTTIEHKKTAKKRKTSYLWGDHRKGEETTYH